MPVADKIKEKRERVLAIAKGSSGEPNVTKENYKIELIKALSYYNAFEDNKTRRSWCAKYFKKHEMLDLLKIVGSDLPDYHFLQVGSICRLLDRGQYISVIDQDKIFDKLLEIQEVHSKVKEDKKSQKSTIDKNEILTEQVISYINGEIDSFITNKTTNFSPSGYFKANEIPSVVLKNVSNEFQSLSKELHEIDSSEELQEGYSNFSKRELKKYREMIDGIISSCIVQKPVRIIKNKKVKEKTPKQLTKSTKCGNQVKVGNIELNGETPESIIGSKEVWIYNTKYKSIAVYKSNSGLSIKGTTITGFNSSFGRGLKSPEKFLSIPFAIAALNDEYNKLTTKEYPQNGRLSENTIILKVFK